MAQEDNDIPDRALEQASDWVFRIEARPGDAGLRAAFETWLSADQAHVQAWELACRAWTLAGEVNPASAGTRPVPFASETQGRSRRSRSGRRRGGHSQSGKTLRRVLAPAVAAAMALFILAPTASLWLNADYATRTSENRAIGLDDGSQIVLGAQSAVAKRFTEQQRNVALLSGEAWFDVAHDTARPFVVSAADMTVTVTGTAFDVSITDRTLSVAVAQGSVRVERNGQQLIDVALKPGDRLSIDRASGRASTMAVSLPEIGAWRDDRLAVRGEVLADVVETLDRHYGGVIIISGDRLKDRRVTGVYDLDDPIRALRALTSPYGGGVRRITPWILVVS